MPILSPFRRAAAEAVASALGVDASLFSVGPPPDPAMGDYAVGVFPAAKQLKAAPPALAAKVAGAFQPTELLASAKAAGPYVNFTAARPALFARVFETALLGKHFPPVGAGQTVCIDYSSPNIAKQLAYHHIRSTMIGQALCNMHRALGYDVVGINHLGDWGTTFGMLLAGAAMWGAPEPMTIESLNALYVRFRNAAKENKALEDDARAWFKKLEDGDPAARALWQRMREVSLDEFQEVYDVLGVKFDVVRGESAFEGDMPRVIDLLAEKGLSSISEGALVVDLSELNIPPLLLKKQDGATLYATRDLAAAIWRWDNYKFARSLYVVAREQALHFQQMIAVLKKAGFDWAARIEHVPFGLVRIGGRKAGTRSGNVVLLKDVLAEAQALIVEKLRQTRSDADIDVAEVARVVGVGAIIFANLASQREKDVDFSLEQVTNFDGDAGPYVQYAHARVASLLRRSGVIATTDLAAVSPAPLARDEEWALAKLLDGFADETLRAAHTDDPHVIARYLLDVCAAFSRWYTLGNQDPSLKVLVDDTATTRARLALAASTREVLRTGLGLLGIAAPDAM